jgi:tripartite-type tricarboxylate transporter receptor subunit TctC
MVMMTRRARLGTGLLCLASSYLFTDAPTFAQTYLTAPVRIITQVGAGNGPDVALRIVAEHLARMWGQQVVVVNQPGAGGLFAARAAIAAQPDGHTLILAGASAYVGLSELQRNLPFRMTDFVPIGLLGEVPMVVAASPTLAVSSLAELIALSNRQPGGLAVATSARGDFPHLAAELFRSRAEADLTPIHYQNMPAAMADVISGRVAASIEGFGGPSARTLKLLAISSHARLPWRPEVPTVAETVPGFVATGWQVVAAPPGTPATMVKKLSDDMYAVLARPDVQRRFQDLGTSTRPMSVPDLSDFIRSEQELWGPVARRVGLATQ